MKTKNLTILFTDIAGFTEVTSQQSRKENEELLATHNQILLPILRRFRGKLIKMIGDALLIVFSSPTDAMLCAMAMQDALFGYNRSAEPEKKIHIRIAASLGEVRVAKKDIFGEPVNLTSRIESITPPDEIYFSDAVYMTMNKAEVPCTEVGIKTLKGIAEPVRIWQIPRFSKPRLVPEDVMNSEDISDLVYPYGGAHLVNLLPEYEGLLSGFAAGRGLYVKLAMAAAAVIIIGLSFIPFLQESAEDVSADSFSAPVEEVSLKQEVAAAIPEPEKDLAGSGSTAVEMTSPGDAVASQAPSKMQSSEEAALETPPEPKASPPRTEVVDPEVARLQKKLRSPNSGTRRDTIRKIARSHGQNTLLLKTVEQELLRGYNKNLEDKQNVDAISWMCKVLAASGDKHYRKALDTVAAKATNRKIKKYAAKTRAQLN